VKAIPSINAALIKKGEDIDDFAIQDNSVGDNGEAPKRQKTKSKKSNIDATSDEDDG
jgi:hypothetical protein